MLYELSKKKAINDKIFDFEVESFNSTENVKAGQFFYIDCGGKSFLRRPISICDVLDGKLRFIFEIRGIGTYELSKKKCGEKIDILGPFGKPFNTEFGKNKISILIGGGIGIIPLFKLSKELEKVVAILGFKTKESIFLKEEFVSTCDKVIITTDDGSFGKHGNAFEALEDTLEREENKKNIGALYTCGPKKLIYGVAKFGITNNIKTQVSMEEHMGCGIGACMACVCDTTEGKMRVCKEGPVFDSKKILNNFEE
ncbi:MAG: dihydroorotate dehydrogenase electron transfer subunit [Clostridiales bacterium]|nr:dihydroorotate dehydrogenase electron transfer subunit [Clostridiales bacterium]